MSSDEIAAPRADKPDPVTGGGPRPPKRWRLLMVAGVFPTLVRDPPRPSDHPPASSPRARLE